MKETTFINSNKKKWHEFEKARDGVSAKPEEIGELFTEVNDDLSYSQTFYGRRTVRAYLNQLAQGVHLNLYKQKGESLKKFWKAWSIQIPLEIYKSRKNLLFALVMFLIWTIVGAITTHYNPEFIDIAAGNGMLRRSEHWINRDDPLGFYGDTSQTSMFFQITLNNIGVALKCFFAGIIFSLGTHILLFKNSMMLGAFQYYYKLKGLLLTSFLAIWIHGAFEISAIVIASGAGFTLGHSLLFPGSYTRLQSFQLGAKRGIRIMLSLIPVFILAGFLESFVTRNYQTLPDWSKWCIILFSFAIIVFYYVVFPIMVARKHPDLLNKEELITYQPFYKVFNLQKIRSAGDVVRDSLRYFTAHLSKILRIIIVVALPVVLFIIAYQYYNYTYELQSEFYTEDFLNRKSGAFFSALTSIIFGSFYSDTSTAFSFYWVGMLLWTIPFTIIVASVFYSFETQDKALVIKDFLKYLAKKGWKLLIAVCIVSFALRIFPPGWWWMLWIFVLPFLMMLPAVLNFFNGFKIGKAFTIGGKFYLGLFWSYLVINFLAKGVLLLFDFYLTDSIPSFNGEELNPALLDYISDLLKNVWSNDETMAVTISNGLRVTVYVVWAIFYVILMAIPTVFFYYSYKEELEANGLKRAFKKFGKRSRTQETKLDFE